MSEEKDIEYKIYQLMCAGCEREHYCHNACETCEEYDEELEKANAKRQSKSNKGIDYQ